MAMIAAMTRTMTSIGVTYNLLLKLLPFFTTTYDKYTSYICKLFSFNYNKIIVNRQIYISYIINL